jgi:hypothetical protein
VSSSSCWLSKAERAEADPDENEELCDQLFDRQYELSRQISIAPIADLEGVTIKLRLAVSELTPEYDPVMEPSDYETIAARCASDALAYLG